MQQASNGHISIKLILAVTASWYLAQMGYYSQFQLASSVMERYGVNDATTGLMMSKEVLVYALMGLIMAGPVTRISRARLAIVGALILLGCNIVAAMTESFEVLRYTRMVAGFAGGMIAAAGNAAAATSANPQRVFAIAAVAWGLTSSITAGVIPYMTSLYGAFGGYIAMVVALVLFAPILFWLPRPVEEFESDSERKRLMASLSPLGRFAETIGVRDAPNVKFALFAFLAIFIYELGQGAIQFYLERFGVNAGMDEITVGKVVGIASLVGLIGGTFAAWLSDRYGNLKPALIGIATNAIVASTMALTTSATMFGVMYFAWNVCFYFVLPYILGIMSEMDKKGRWAVVTSAVWWLGAAPGSTVGGYIVTNSGFEGLSVLPLVVGAISIVIFYFTLKTFYSKERES